MQHTALANLINSCRRIAQIQWRDVLQSLSWAENKLAGDRAGVYARMDFETRDRCRGAVEEIARWSKCSEQKTIEAALALAKTADNEVARHRRECRRRAAAQFSVTKTQKAINPSRRAVYA